MLQVGENTEIPNLQFTCVTGDYNYAQHLKLSVCSLAKRHTYNKAPC